MVTGLTDGGAILHDGTRLSEHELRHGKRRPLRFIDVDELGNELKTDEEAHAAR